MENLLKKSVDTLKKGGISSLNSKVVFKNKKNRKDNKRRPGVQRCTFY